MPRVATLAGNIAIFMYAKDHNPAHVHVIAGDSDAAMTFDGAILVGKLPAKVRKVAAAWVVQNKGMLVALWEELSS